jgi:hypothetical protein
MGKDYINVKQCKIKYSIFMKPLKLYEQAKCTIQLSKFRDEQLTNN